MAQNIQKVLQKLLNVDILLAVGMILAFLGSASYIPEVAKSFVAPIQGVGFLLIVLAAGMALFNKFKKRS